MDVIAVMQTHGPKHANREVHQTVTENWIEVPTPAESIRVGFANQKVSGRAGLASFAGFVHWHGLGRLLRQALPSRAEPSRSGRKPLLTEDLALGFILGILAGAQKLTQVAPSARRSIDRAAVRHQTRGESVELQSVFRPL